MDIVNSFITKTELKARGWTDGMINKFMPEPDKKQENPKYQRAPQMCLYSVIRVTDIEHSQEFHEAFIKQRRRVKG
jgi:hypothetical protein